MGRMRQIGRAYKLTHEYDKALPYLMIGAFVLPIAIGLLVSLLWPHPIYLAFLGASTGLLLAMIVLVRRAKAATYKRYTGQAGSAEVALGMLPKQWVSAGDRRQPQPRRGPPHTRSRRPGAHRRRRSGPVRQLLNSEVKKHERVAYGIPVSTIVMGDREGQVPLDKLADHIRKMPKVLNRTR